jgi:hypothetical protein
MSTYCRLLMFGVFGFGGRGSFDRGSCVLWSMARTVGPLVSSVIIFSMVLASTGIYRSSGGSGSPFFHVIMCCLNPRMAGSNVESKPSMKMFIFLLVVNSTPISLLCSR